MKAPKLFLLAPLFLGSLPAFANPSTLQMDCKVPGFGIQLKLEAKLAESRPEEHLEAYVLQGRVEYTDSRGEELEFTHIPVSGTFDNSRGVIRISFRPNVPLLFNVFSRISVTEFPSKHQLFQISSEGKKGPNGGTSGSPCTIVQG